MKQHQSCLYSIYIDKLTSYIYNSGFVIYCVSSQVHMSTYITGMLAHVLLNLKSDSITWKCQNSHVSMHVHHSSTLFSTIRSRFYFDDGGILNFHCSN